MKLPLPLAKGDTSKNLQTILIRKSLCAFVSVRKHAVYIILCLSQVYLQDEVEFFHLDSAGQKCECMI